MDSSEQRHWSSREWRNHFLESLKEQRVDWQLPSALNVNRDRKLVRSLQAWQRGETSDGSHLLRAAAKYAKRQNDPDYLEAIRLFIREEQKHGENLGKYLDTIGAPRLGFDLGDWLFRRVRYFNGSIEIWTITVIIVEMYAQFYYAALSKAANCPLLTDICKDILIDEAHHIRFQAERLGTIIQGRSYLAGRATRLFYRFIFGIVTPAVWIGHGLVFRQAGIDYRQYHRKASRRFARILKRLGSVSLTEPTTAEQVETP